jgi:hypothetical protein
MFPLEEKNFRIFQPKIRKARAHTRIERATTYPLNMDPLSTRTAGYFSFGSLRPFAKAGLLQQD